MRTQAAYEPVLARIVTFLSANGEAKAKKIAREIDVDKTTVNSVLYFNSSIFEAIGDRPPIWRLKQDPPSVSSQESMKTTDSHAPEARARMQYSSEILLEALTAERRGDFSLATELYDKSRSKKDASSSQDVSDRVKKAGSSSRAFSEANFQSESFADTTIDVEHLVTQYPGITVEEIQKLFNLSLNEVATGIRRVKYLVLVEPRDGGDSFSPSELALLQSLSEAGTLAFPLSSEEYDEFVRRGFVDGRTSMRVVQVFGTWRRACELASVEAPPSNRAHYENRWTKRELSEVVARYLSEPEYRGSVHRFSEWRQGNLKVDEIPSTGTLKNHLGPSWRMVQNSGLLVLREKWMNEDGVIQYE
jgi:hypothetical protein